jgi:hypothetical protein
MAVHRSVGLQEDSIENFIRLMSSIITCNHHGFLLFGSLDCEWDAAHTVETKMHTTLCSEDLKGRGIP